MKSYVPFVKECNGVISVQEQVVVDLVGEVGYYIFMVNSQIVVVVVEMGGVVIAKAVGTVLLVTAKVFNL